jgi:hypothetical protein
MKTALGATTPIGRGMGYRRWDDRGRTEIQMCCHIGGWVPDENNVTRIVSWRSIMARGTVKWFNPTKGRRSYGFCAMPS